MPHPWAGNGMQVNHGGGSTNTSTVATKFIAEELSTSQFQMPMIIGMVLAQGIRFLLGNKCIVNSCGAMLPGKKWPSMLFLFGSNAHHLAPTLTTQLRWSPLSSNDHHSALMLTTQLWCSPIGSNAHQLALTLTSWLRCSPIGSDTHHLAEMPTTPLQCSPLSWNAHHLALMLTTWLKHPSLDSNALHWPTLPSTQLQHPPLASSTHHSTTATFVIWAVFGQWHWRLLCLTAPVPLKKTPLIHYLMNPGFAAELLLNAT